MNEKIAWTEGKSIPGNPQFCAERGPHRLVVWLQTGPDGKWWCGFSGIKRGPSWVEVAIDSKTAAQAKRRVIAASIEMEREDRERAARNAVGELRPREDGREPRRARASDRRR